MELASMIDLNSVPWKRVVLGITYSMAVWETYLNMRQFNKLVKEKAVPVRVRKAFEPDVIEEKEFDKARLYSLDKLRYVFVSNAFSVAQTTLILHFDFFPLLWTFSGKLLTDLGFTAEAEIVHSLIFTGLFTLFSTLINMPLSLYYTFVIEERHGFNKQTLALYFSDTLKTLALTAILGGPILAGFLMTIRWAGPSFYLYLWLGLVILTFATMIIYPSIIQPLFNKFEPLPDGELKTKIDELAKRVKFPLTNIYTVDGSKRSSHSNAYFIGLFNSKRIVIFDTLIKISTVDEIVAVLGHEIGHWYHSHIVSRLSLVQAHYFVMFYLFSTVISLGSLYESFGFTTKPMIVGFLLFSFVYNPIDTIMIFFINALSRKQEFEADEYAGKLGYAGLLRTALIKMHKENRGNLNPDSLYSMWNYTHPPVVERLARLVVSK